MPSMFTDSLRLEEQGIGENDNTWGNKLNSTIRMTDRAIAGHVSVGVTTGDTVLTSVNNAEDEARYKIIELTGTLTGNVNVQVPAVSKEYIVWDSTTRGGFTLNFRLGAAGNTVAIPATTTRAFGISTDGTDWRPMSADLATETAPGIVEIATTAEAQAGTTNTVVLTPARLQDVTATETRKGVVELSTDAEAQTGTDTARALTPANLQAVTATETRKGVAEVATEAEARTGTDNTTIITPLRLQSVTATETRKGVIEIATQPEVDTGTDTTRAVVPSKLKAYVDTRLGGTSNLGTAAQRNVGTGLSDVVETSRLNTRLGTTGNLGSLAVQNTIGTSDINNGAVTLAKMSANSVDTSQLVSSSVTTVKIEVSERMNTNNVLGATAAAAPGAVGSYAFLKCETSGTKTPGTNVGGSGLRWSNANGNDVNGTGPAGTWTIMGAALAGSTTSPEADATSLWLRIS